MELTISMARVREIAMARVRHGPGSRVDYGQSGGWSRSRRHRRQQDHHQGQKSDGWYWLPCIPARVRWLLSSGWGLSSGPHHSLKLDPVLRQKDGTAAAEPRGLETSGRGGFGLSGPRRRRRLTGTRRVACGLRTVVPHLSGRAGHPRQTARHSPARPFAVSGSEARPDLQVLPPLTPPCYSGRGAPAPLPTLVLLGDPPGLLRSSPSTGPVGRGRCRPLGPGPKPGGGVHITPAEGRRRRRRRPRPGPGGRRSGRRGCGRSPAGTAPGTPPALSPQIGRAHV